MADTNTDPLDLCFCGGHVAAYINERIPIDKRIPLCHYHFAETAMYYHRWFTTDQHEMYAKRGLTHVPETTVVRQTGGGPVVYYVAMNGHVKIGTSRRFVERMRTLYVQPDDVLAIEPGGRPLETSRHQQFQSFRLPNTELFRHNGVLDELIETLAARYPFPWTAADSINLGKTTSAHIPVEQANREAELLKRIER